MTIEGRMLDFLIHNYLMPAYPEAKIGQPFALGHRIEQLDVQPAAVGVLIWPIDPSGRPASDNELYGPVAASFAPIR